MRYYSGPIECPGCGISGTVKSRYGAHSLCSDCKKLIELGKGIKKHSAGYSSIALGRHCLRDIYLIKEAGSGKYGKNSVYISGEMEDMVTALNKFLKTLDDGKKDTTEYRLSLLESSYGSSDILHVRTDTVLELLNFLNTLADYSSAVYKDGFNTGKSLLVGLNSGKLSLTDFEERVKRQQ